MFEDIFNLHLPHSTKPLSYLGATAENAENITIWVSQKHPEETIVHEIIHQILGHEGYPTVEINKNYQFKNIPNYFIEGLPKLQADLTSTIQHPEVFRRMEKDFDLNLECYYEIQVKQKIDRFNNYLTNERNVNPKDYLFCRQQDILIGLDYFLWKKQNNELLKIFFDNFPDAYQSCLALHKKLKKYDFSDPKNMYDAGKLIMKHIINYGDKKSGTNYNQLWRTLNLKSYQKQILSK